jgi:hypothetical protein
MTNPMQIGSNTKRGRLLWGCIHTLAGMNNTQKNTMKEFLNSIGINIGLTIAGFLGSLLLLPKQRNWKMQLVSVFSGSLCATYLAPVLIGFLNINAPNIQYGLAFLVGFSGVKIAEVLEAKLLKTLNATPSQADSAEHTPD